MTEKTVTGTEAMVFFCKSSPHPVFLLVVPGTDPLLSCLRATTLHIKSPHRCSYPPWDLLYLALPLFLVSMPLCSTLHHSHPALTSPPLLSPLIPRAHLPSDPFLPTFYFSGSAWLSFRCCTLSFFCNLPYTVPSTWLFFPLLSSTRWSSNSMPS